MFPIKFTRLFTSSNCNNELFHDRIDPMTYRIDEIQGRRGKPAILLRRHWREGKRIRKQTVANLTRHPGWLAEGIRSVVDAGTGRAGRAGTVEIRRSLPHGHAAAILGTLKSLGFERILAREDSRNRRIALAAIAARIADPLSKLATSRLLSEGTASSSLGALIGLGEVSGNEVLAMLDWLLGRQPWIERSLANRRLAEDALILYDLSSSCAEGRGIGMAARGHSRDGRSDKKQITYGLLCDREGCPVAIEVFEGNASDPSTVGRQVDKIRRRFRLGRVALAGDRGMITGARIREELRPAGLDWISALKSTDIRKLAKGPPAPDVPVPDAVAEIASPDFPGERLMVCFNPRLRDERRRKRDELLRAAEDRLGEIARTVRRKGSRLRGEAAIARRVGAAIGRLKVSKHFEIRCGDDDLSWSRRQDRIDREAALDGLWVVRTSLDADCIGADEAVEAYKSLGQVEQAFRQIKTGRLRIRPIFVYAEARVRAHVFLCMLAYYVEWHMRKRLAPILFDEDDPEAARAQRASPVEPAKPSPSARAKAAGKNTPDATAVHSFHTLLADLSTVVLNDVSIGESESFKLVTTPTTGQQKAFDLLGVNPRKMFPKAGR